MSFGNVLKLTMVLLGRMQGAQFSGIEHLKRQDHCYASKGQRTTMEQ
jgi:hypothetical protein